MGSGRALARRREEGLLHGGRQCAAERAAAIAAAGFHACEMNEVQPPSILTLAMQKKNTRN